MKRLILIICLLSTNLSSQTMLYWNHVKKAVHYRIEISTDEDLYYLVNEYDNIKENHLKINIKKGTYFLYLAGIDKYGIPGYSLITKITIDPKVDHIVTIGDTPETGKGTLSSKKNNIVNRVQPDTSNIKKEASSYDNDTTTEKRSSEKRKIESSTEDQKKEKEQNVLSGIKNILFQSPSKKKQREKEKNLMISLHHDQEQIAPAPLKLNEWETKHRRNEDFIVLPAGGKLDYSGNPDDIHKLYYSINDTSYKEWNIKAPIIFKKNGYYNVSYYAVDNVGNKSSVQHINVAVDNTPPKIRLFFEGKTYYQNKIYYVKPSQTLSFYAHDNISGLSNIYYAINDKQYKLYNKNDIISPQTQKTNVISFYAIDKVGNRSSKFNKKIIYDNIAPKIKCSFSGKVKTISSDSYLINNNTKIAINTVDLTPSTVKVSINNNPAFIYTSPFHIDDKTAQIKIEASDKLNNRSHVLLKVKKE